MELVVFYKISFLVAFLTSAGLTLTGKHLLLRSNILAVFLCSQLAFLGKMCAVIVAPENQLLALIVSLTFYFCGLVGLSKVKVELNLKSPIIISMYLFLTSLQYFLVTFFPALDPHFSVGFFGNIVTASDFENNLLIISFMLFLIMYYKRRAQLLKNSFEISIFGRLKYGKREAIVDQIILSVPVALSLFALGFVYTLSFLMISAVILSVSCVSNLSTTKLSVLISGVSSVGGLLLSILNDRLATSPAQILILTFLSLLFLALPKITRSAFGE